VTDHIKCDILIDSETRLHKNQSSMTVLSHYRQHHHPKAGNGAVVAAKVCG
jgi:hypothetical protein